MFYCCKKSNIALSMFNKIYIITMFTSISLWGIPKSRSVLQNWQLRSYCLQILLVDSTRVRVKPFERFCKKDIIQHGRIPGPCKRFVRTILFICSQLLISGIRSTDNINRNNLSYFYVSTYLKLKCYLHNFDEFSK